MDHGSTCSGDIVKLTEDPRAQFMSTDLSAPAASSNRTLSRHELTRFYRAIGIPAVASAAQAARMAPAKPRTDRVIPAFLRDLHAVG